MYLLAGAGITMCIILGAISKASAQRTISGTVLSAEDGAPLPGTTVKIAGTNVGANTDENGRFTLPLSGSELNLSITSLGYLPLDTSLTLPLKEPLILSLRPNASLLDETVVIGYGTTTRRLNTGSVGQIRAEEISRQPLGNPLAALQGRVPGLLVTQSSGLPGSSFKVRIRGMNSIAQGNDPLFIIDGVPFAANNSNIQQVGSALSFDDNGLSPFNSINPSDIESIEILKDADATAIYGSRGANGVVLITTKRGKPGELNLDVNAYTGVSRVTRVPEMLNTRQYVEMRREAYANDGVTPTEANAYDILLWDTTRYTNWAEELIGGTAKATDVKVVASGGSKQTQFLIGAGYRKETTVYPGETGSKRGSVRFRINHTSTNGKASVDFSGNYSTGNNNLLLSDLTRYINLPPNLPELYDDYGNLNWESQGYSFDNPMALLHQPYQAKTDNLLGNLRFTYQFSKNLIFKANLGYNSMHVEEQNAYPLSSQNPARRYSSFATFGRSKLKSLIIEPQVQYMLSIGEGKLDILAGVSGQRSITSGSTIQGFGYSSDALLGSISGASDLSSSDNYSEYRYAAVFGRLNYNWENKYVINLTARRDGSSRFGPGKQFANFGAVGVAWLFSNERFIKTNISAISYGKFRVSYGTSGNDAIGDYGYLDTYGSTRYPYLGTAGISPTRLSNSTYGWEVNKKFEAALEMGFLEDRLLLIAAFFRNRSGNQLVRSSLPSQSGFTSITENLPAVVQNTGLELVLSTHNIETSNFSWSSGLNITLPKNKLVSFPGLAESRYRNEFSIQHPLDIGNGFRLRGVNPETGLYEFQSKNGEVVSSPSYPEDNVVGLVSLDPTFYGGLNNSLRYKNWALDIFFTFRKQVGYSYRKSAFQAPGRMYNQPVQVLDRWQRPGDKASVQRYTTTTSNSAYRINRMIQLYTATNVYADASYIRLRNLSLGYYLPVSWLGGISVTNCRIYFQGQNLFTVTNYTGSDPETQRLYQLPPLKTYTFGFQITI